MCDVSVVLHDVARPDQAVDVELGSRRRSFNSGDSNEQVCVCVFFIRSVNKTNK